MEEKYLDGLFDSICPVCKHYHGNNQIEFLIGTCDAYPDGIPIEVWKREINHIEPYSQDNGIQFEPIDDEILVNAVLKM